MYASYFFKYRRWKRVKLSILRIRRSQLISKHGVGSVFPGTDGVSRLTAGLDKWFTYEYEDSTKNIKIDDFKIKEWIQYWFRNI